MLDFFDVRLLDLGNVLLLRHVLRPRELRGFLLLLADPVNVLRHVAAVLLVDVDNGRAARVSVITLALRRHREIANGRRRG